MRFYDAKSGEIRIDGKDIRRWDLTSLRKHITVVTQDTQLFNDTILKNITYGLNESEYTLEQVYEAAKQANAYDFIMEMDDGFYTRVGERGTRVSGGQKQRIAIARAFMRKAKILYLDEGMYYI